MGAKIVGTRELLGAKVALEVGGMLLYSARLLVLSGIWAIRVCEIEDVVARVDGRGGGAARLVTGTRARRTRVRIGGYRAHGEFIGRL